MFFTKLFPPATPAVSPKRVALYSNDLDLCSLLPSSALLVGSSSLLNV